MFAVIHSLVLSFRLLFFSLITQRPLLGVSNVFKKTDYQVSRYNKNLVSSSTCCTVTSKQQAKDLVQDNLLLLQCHSMQVPHEKQDAKAFPDVKHTLYHLVRSNSKHVCLWLSV